MKRMIIIVTIIITWSFFYAYNDYKRWLNKEWEKGCCWGLVQGRLEGKHGIAEHNKKYCGEYCLGLNGRLKTPTREDEVKEDEENGKITNH